MKKFNIAVVGATGMVGNKFLQVLEERNLPVENYYLFASAKSAGRQINFMGKPHTVIELTESNVNALSGKIDFALFSAGGSVSAQFAPVFVKAGATVVDNSSQWRMDKNVPLVVPEVNPEDVKWNSGIIANPNCTTIQMVVALKPINDLSPIKKVHVATYQAASGAGAAAMDELLQQHAQLAKGEKPTVEKFAYQLAYNVIPQVDVFTENGYTKEEMKMYNETKKIMHAPNISVSATCVRVPVMRAHSEAIWLETEQPLELDTVRKALSEAEGVVLLDNPEQKQYPMPLDIADKDPVYVGRLRKDLTCECGISFWIVGDQIKKGAALNAVQIAQYMLTHGAFKK